ncbi:NAD(P)-binding protein [Ophiobolus disseminans]|uniref:NAD(P)-binding protein n=1 Tax=Ophiobolus disseminans TaxID=1469910 RepID=A0A6A6ZY74_9PLEO|nr:NAD(P)-binding protein [Ophiobolus disseminans]
MSDSTPTHLRKVALIGGTGNLGSHFLSALLAAGNHSITVLTRPSSTATFPPAVTVTKVDYDSDASIQDALRGHDVLIITLPAQAPPDQHPRIVAAAAKVGVKYIVPNYYGYALSTRTAWAPSDTALGNFERFVDDARSAEKDGVKWIALVCGFWYEFSIGMGEPWAGFDIAGRRVTLLDEGRKKVNVSTWELCGKAMAKVLSLPIEKTNGGGLALQDWDNEGLYISSFLVSQREILDSLHRVLGTSDEDWTIRYQPGRERDAEGMKELGEGKMTGFAKALYAKIFEEGGRGDYETGQGIDNEKLGLEKEELDVATKRAVAMVEGGFGYRG